MKDINLKSDEFEIKVYKPHNGAVKILNFPKVLI